jgi:hypothetical protein
VIIVELKIVKGNPNTLAAAHNCLGIRAITNQVESHDASIQQVLSFGQMNCRYSPRNRGASTLQRA